MAIIIKKSRGKSNQKRASACIIRKIAALAAVLALLCVFCACDVNELSSLREFSRAYAGEYECFEATLGGKDLLDKTRFVHLSLERDGTFTVSAKNKAGLSAEKSGSYEYDEESGVLTFRAEHGGKRYEKRAELKNGAFTISHSLGGRELVLKFRVKG